MVGMAPVLDSFFFRLYDPVWSVALPLLKFNQRLKVGYRQRVLKTPLPGQADVWVQAASVGEALLVEELMKQLAPAQPLRAWITTNTAQGLQILQRVIADIEPLYPGLTLDAGYFHFDKPALMRKAVGRLDPKVMILLETELWPAHLAALKDAGVTVLLLNGRITKKSLKHYRLWPSLWRRLRPQRILAVSDADARRFEHLFGDNGIGVMPNIKFDRLGDPATAAASPNPLAKILPADTPVLVLGSVRQPEEDAVQKIILHVRHRHPDAVIALFPRHLHRLDAWISFLEAQRLPWCRRSQAGQAVGAGSIVLWDSFGELSHAYRLATAAFVGGSLAPLGGQNFLEPLICGIRPVIGPYWETFEWVGEEIMNLGLVRVVEDWQEAAATLSDDMALPAPAEDIRRQARRYIEDRQGGTAMACALVREYL
jgi:3-deoxy-D-manno-octulosonic-acid transferase